MDDDQQSAYDLLRDLFSSYGLPNSVEILDVIKQSAIEGDTPDLVQLRLQETDAWKQRFAGNEKRKQQGLNVLSVGEYIQQEKQYADVLHAAGVPNGFYDDPDDFANFIGNSVSVAELQERVNIAGDIVSREDPSVLRLLEERGITKGGLLAYALDPDRAAPLVKRDANSILIGAAALRAGLSTTKAEADSVAELGVGEQQAIQGFGQVSEFYDQTDKLGDVYGIDFDMGDAIGEVFQAGSGEQRKRIARQERSAFTGQSNYGVNRKDSAGQF